ncbi:hypothetical protein ANRL3_01960 [Anaerolineae bacterium]|nr:hypothetical protein ANRL3_01960 [Anaerolineae bacterium]
MRITKTQIEALFASMQKDGLNPDQELLWGFFFTDPNKNKLEKAWDGLQGLGYSFVEIHRDEKNLYWLHVERIERHTVASLDARNQELYKFADQLGLESYDGMDVGTPPVR